MTSAMRMGQRAVNMHVQFLRSACENANRDQKKWGDQRNIRQF
jgi:hypothetical protein